MRLLRVVLMTLITLSLALLPAAAAECHCHDGHDADIAAAPPAGVHSPESSHHDGAKGCGMMCCGSCAVSLVPVATWVARLHRAEPVALSADDLQRDGLPSTLSLRPPIAA